MSDIVERLRKSGMPIDQNIDPDVIADEIESLRQQLEEVRERERLLRDDVHNAVELNYSLSKRVKVLAKQLKSCLANKWKARCEKAEAELAALKAGQGSPNLPLGEPVAAWNGQYDQNGNAIEVNTSAQTIPEGRKPVPSTQLKR